MSGGPDVAIGVEVDPVPIGGQTIMKVGRIFISTILLRTRTIHVDAGIKETFPPRRIADFRREKIYGADRRNHEKHGNEPETPFHYGSPLSYDLFSYIL
jgi:hypothetical protein